ncbi:MAG: DUF805 domain-containing protein [Candidatus Woesebacteria bacterium]|nr:DUF805 domain-containing protein [Candidatus Woesebacteria bacterium]
MHYYIEAIKKYAVFKGRSSRKQYWMFVLFNFIISLVLVLVEVLLGIDSNSVLSNIYSMAVLIPSIAIGVRRMHDLDKSGWFLLIPIYNFILTLTKGTEGDNEYGSGTN